MCKKIILGVICFIVIQVIGVVKEEQYQVEENAIKNVETEVAIEEGKQNETNELSEIQKNNNQQDSTEKIKPEEVSTNKTKENKKIAIQKDNTTQKKNEVPKEKKEEDIKKPKEEIKKEETQNTPKITYNSAETQRLKSDIDNIAKKNKDLWGEDGKKLYEVEDNSIAYTNSPNNYMYPYSYSQLEGKVLNVYSVKFLIYAIDYEKSGFQKETRYYIYITQLKKK